MPNHFHLLLKQSKDKGILTFMRSFQNSYAHYFNHKAKRKGTLFQGRFKTIRVETEAQLLHLSRYIHLNPLSSYVIKDLTALWQYPYSSLLEYINLQKSQYCQKQIILKQFSNRLDYKKFVSDRADYQQSLEKIKHQLLES